MNQSTFNENVYQVNTHDEFLSGRTIINVEVDGGPVTLWPLNQRIEGNGKYSFKMFVEDDFFHLEFEGSRIVQDLPPIFALMENSFTLNSDGQNTKIEVIMRDHAGVEIENGVQLQSGDIVSRFAESKKFEAKNGRIALSIKVQKPSQLCIDFYKKDQDYPELGLVLQYNPKDESGPHVNVWLDTMKQGVFVRDLRKKLGYYQIAPGTSFDHTLLITLKPEKGKGRIGAIVQTSEKKTKIISHADNGVVDIDGFDYVMVRETQGITGDIGKYEVEVIG